MSGEAPVVSEEVTSGEDVDRVVKAGGRAVCCNGKTLMATGVCGGHGGGDGGCGVWEPCVAVGRVRREGPHRGDECKDGIGDLSHGEAAGGRGGCHVLQRGR